MALESPLTQGLETENMIGEIKQYASGAASPVIRASG